MKKIVGITGLIFIFFFSSFAQKMEKNSSFFQTIELGMSHNSSGPLSYLGFGLHKEIKKTQWNFNIGWLLVSQKTEDLKVQDNGLKAIYIKAGADLLSFLYGKYGKVKPKVHFYLSGQALFGQVQTQMPFEVKNKIYFSPQASLAYQWGMVEILFVVQHLELDIGGSNNMFYGGGVKIFL